MRCIFGHRWDGCACQKCGEIRDKEHTWQLANGKCERICTVCGKKEPLPHRLESMDGQCRERCAVCGEERGLLHVFVEDACQRCGVAKGSLGTAAFVKTTEAAPVSGSVAVQAQWLDNALKTFAGQGDWQLLEPACRRYANGLSVIAEEWKAFGRISPDTERLTDFGPCMDVCMRRYLQKRIPNGVFNVGAAQAAFDRKAMQANPGSLHPNVGKTYLDAELKKMLASGVLETAPLLLPSGLATAGACDQIVQCALKARPKDALKEGVYRLLTEHVQSAMKTSGIHGESNLS